MENDRRYLETCNLYEIKQPLNIVVSIKVVFQNKENNNDLAPSVWWILNAFGKIS